MFEYIKFTGLINFLVLAWLIPLAFLGKLDWSKEGFSRLVLRKNFVVAEGFRLVLILFTFGQMLLAYQIFLVGGFYDHFVSILLCISGSIALILCAIFRTHGWHDFHYYSAWTSGGLIAIALIVYTLESILKFGFSAVWYLPAGLVVIFFSAVLFRINYKKVNAYEELKVFMLVASMNILLTFHILRPW